MRETRREAVRIPGEPELEGLLELPPSGPVRGGVVVAHPHPLYGGTMQQPIVHHVAKAARQAGLATLRFNFRGVEGSAGSFHGLEERGDVRRAAVFLRERLPDLPVALAGYSFGAVMSALAVAEGEPAAALALVAFAVAWDEFMPAFFTPLRDYRGKVLALCGELDDVGPPAEVETFLRGLGVDLVMMVIPGADHYFGGRTAEVGEKVGGFLGDALVRDEVS